jgi:hypothetical protein
MARTDREREEEGGGRRRAKKRFLLYVKDWEINHRRRLLESSIRIPFVSYRAAE